MEGDANKIGSSKFKSGEIRTFEVECRISGVIKVSIPAATQQEAELLAYVMRSAWGVHELQEKYETSLHVSESQEPSDPPHSPSCLTIVDRELAVALAHVFRGALNLNGLRAITPEVADALSEHRGYLRLDGLAELDLETANLLMGSHGGPDALSLAGLTEVTEDLAQWLGIHYQRLELPIRALSASAARKLGGNIRELVLRGDQDLPSDLAKVIAEREYITTFPDLTELTLATASILSRSKARLDFDLLRSLSLEVADALAEHGTYLSLARLEKLEERVAAALSKYRGWGMILPARAIEGLPADAVAGFRNIDEFMLIDENNFSFPVDG